MRVAAIGHGAGGRDCQQRPNILRAVLGERVGSREDLTVLDSDVFGPGQELRDCLVERQMVVELLTQQGLTVSVAESCSGGLLAKLLTDLPGSSAYLRAGVVAYANEAKASFLGVSPDLIERQGAVSSEVAVAMATGMRRKAGSDLAMAVTGIAGPSGGSADKPVGTVFLALADTSGCRSQELHLAGSREQVRTVTAAHALNMIRLHLTGRPAP
jgi:nicotinamide-nucleotide amidase